MSTATEPRRGGRHRGQACDDLILAATLEVLGEIGYGGLTVSAVIERAGVSSATLYRRWATKQHLVAAALASVSSDPMDTDTGSLASDLTAFLHRVARSITARQESLESLALEVRRNPELERALREKLLAPRLAELHEILARAHRRGELSSPPPPTDEALSLVAGPVYHRSFALQAPLTPAFVRAVVRFALQGLGATGS